MHRCLSFVVFLWGVGVVFLGGGGVVSLCSLFNAKSIYNTRSVVPDNVKI